MSGRSKFWGFIAITVALISALGVPDARAQAAPQSGTAQKPLMSEEAFKNVQVLRGIPASEFIETMGFFAVALTANCTTCHGDASAGSWDHYADDTPLKQATRRMVIMVNSINQANFGGKREVTCFTCHRGDRVPRITPTIAEVYKSTFDPIEPDKMLSPTPGDMTADQILDRYIQAIGGAQNLAKVTSFTGKGTSMAYAEESYPAEVYAKAPDQFAIITHTDAGDRTTAFDGRNGWVAMPRDDKPIPVLPLIQGDLIGARLDATIYFPSAIKQALSDWRIVAPITINDNVVKNEDVNVIQGTADGGRTPVNLYFDAASGLLVRQVRYTDTKVGLSATQVDYEDYRSVGGIKMPFKTTVSWLDGQTVYQMTEIKPNVPIDEAKFGKPAPPAPKSASR
jgi:photosynthetic reaction center cytochrome c subunit